MQFQQTTRSVCPLVQQSRPTSSDGPDAAQLAMRVVKPANSRIAINCQPIANHSVPDPCQTWHQDNVTCCGSSTGAGAGKQAPRVSLGGRRRQGWLLATLVDSTEYRAVDAQSSTSEAFVMLNGNQHAAQRLPGRLVSWSAGC